MKKKVDKADVNVEKTGNAEPVGRVERAEGDGAAMNGKTAAGDETAMNGKTAAGAEAAMNGKTAAGAEPAMNGKTAAGAEPAGGHDPEKRSGCETGACAEESEGAYIGSLERELADREKMCGEYLDRLQRAMAEFDNYKKRTVREKEGIYDDAAAYIIAAFLPVVDSVEMAAATVNGSMREGIDMILKQMNEILQKLKVEKIPGAGAQFDPNYHNAVMHVDDETLEKNVVAEVFQSGYLYKEKVVRYSMVKVAN